jgi:hypothetical protein
MVFCLLVTIQSFPQSASAVSCGSIKAQILEEERIGKALWQDFKLRAPNYGTLQKEVAITESFIELLKSDKNRYTKASQNTKCYPSSIAVKIRKNLTLINKWIKTEQTNLKLNYEVSNCDEEFCPTGGYEDYYSNYRSIYALSNSGNTPGGSFSNLYK